MNHDKAALGTRYACFQCGTKFYDLNRPEPTCPECEADQREAPVRDVKSLLQGVKRSPLSDSSGITTSSMGSASSDDDLGLDGGDDDDDSDDDESYEDDDE